ncbi:hypothetical protein RintRC_3862 [Richelia intracellularis]|nr:hypothetical protein RintRC_3862 [Richelia intracellularis]
MFNPTRLSSSHQYLIFLALLNQGMISLNFQRFINGFKR